MYYNKITKKHEILGIVGPDSVGNPHFYTSDMVYFDETYHLSYNIEGCSNPYIFSMRGEEMFMRTHGILQSEWDCDSWCTPEFRLRQIREYAKTITVLWASRKIDYKHFASMKRDTAASALGIVKIAEKAYEGRPKSKEMVRDAIATYLYFKLIERNENQIKEGKNTVWICDHLPTQEEIVDLSKDWRAQPITKQLHLESFNKYKAILDKSMEMGVLKFAYGSKEEADSWSSKQANAIAA